MTRGAKWLAGSDRTARRCVAWTRPPDVFRMVLEVTSTNWSNDMVIKVETYARAGIPVYTVVDRKHDRVLVYADPDGDDYRTCSTYKRGMSMAFPASIGVSLDLPVDRLLDGDGDGDGDGG
ncbi:Uma2 family endonuclease [Streptomyces sp. NPDC018833]|uniref:Uma2 family endonuclease n=1 Tax=Streptomyces sp. NPDC018833 TaxID=3365053 RepID=UPI0037931667